MPGGPVPTDVGASLLRLGAATGVLLLGLGGLVVALRWFTGQAALERRARRRAAGTAPPPAPPVRRPLQAVAADVRRLSRAVAAVPAGAPVARRRGLLAAYDDVLIEAADLLEVPHALAGVPSEARELERLRLVGALEAAGLVVSG
ncbi:hypothetical protein [Modestobacter sp. NPDC049651]|uniref:hypothetical protein n=1 Tax=unclassified Modestobacter TaxID=2643866 RepID=UPI0033C5509E